MRCICGNAIDEPLARLGATACRPCRENTARHNAAIRLRATGIKLHCPDPGCFRMLVLDAETAVLRCAMHGPMREVVA
jgi:hypothetical protein